MTGHISRLTGSFCLTHHLAIEILIHVHYYLQVLTKMIIFQPNFNGNTKTVFLIRKYR